MAYWDGERIHYFESQPLNNYPGWELIDCGCCAGIKWGGEYPQECNCNSGMLAHHLKSGVLALYPGGPFVGRK